MEQREFPQPPAASNRWHAGLPAASQSSSVMDRTWSSCRRGWEFLRSDPVTINSARKWKGIVRIEGPIESRELHNITMALL